MKNKKSLIAIVAVFLVVVIGVTFAYFTSSATFNNQFNLGNYNIVTQEVFESPNNWSPGDVTPKSIIATNNGTIDAAVRVSYVESWTDENGDEVDISDIPNDAVIINFTTPSNWTKNGNYYYYNYSLGAGESTTSLIESVSLNSNLNNSNCVMDNGIQTCTSNIQGLAGYHYSLTFTIETVEYDKYQQLWDNIVNYSEVVIPSNRTSDNLQFGDKICIEGSSNECFNFIRYDENDDIVMLAKSNLNVGKDSKDSATNLQDNDVKGYIVNGTRYGVVGFSASNYWNSSGVSYPTDVYDSNYLTEPDFITTCNNTHCYKTPGYSIAYYVERYKSLLEVSGIVVNDARLLTLSEATSSNIGCSTSNNSCPTSGFITNTSFWLGTAYSNNGVWAILNNGRLDGSGNTFGYGYEDVYHFGVRPVIVISKNEVNKPSNNVNIISQAEIVLPTNKTKDTLTSGDEICFNGLTNECFNFVKYNGNDIVLLSKWNLNVGSNAKGNETFLQDSNVKGNISSSVNYGTVAFSYYNYWYDNGIKPEYSSGNSTYYIYDTNYDAKPDFNANGYGTQNYSIAYYVKKYRKLLEGYGIKVKEARLLTVDEATSSSIGCVESTSRCPTNGFVTNTSFWIGSTKMGSGIMYIKYDGVFNNMYYSSDSYNGVRPVIVISKDNI